MRREMLRHLHRLRTAVCFAAPILAAAVLVGALLATATPVEAQVETGAGEPVLLGIGYVALTVSDLDAAVALYTDAAGLDRIEMERLEDNRVLDVLAGRAGVTARSALLRSSNAQVRLFQFDAPSDAARATAATPVPGPGFAHLCYQADAETRTYEQFLAGGATHVGGREMATLNPRNPVSYAYARDPDGILFEVEHITLGRITNHRLSPGFQRIRHISLGTHDIDRLVSFYGALTGTERPRRVGAPNGLSGVAFDQVSGLPSTRMLMAWVPTSNLEIEMTQYLSHPPEPRQAPRPLDALGYSMVVFDVSSLEAARELLLEAGGTIVTDPAPTVGGLIFFGRDPDLNLLGFQVVDDESRLSSARFRTP